MADAFEKVGGNIIAVDTVPEDRVSSYGVIAPKSRDGRLISMSGMVEKPPRETAPSNLAITGRYILQPEIFGLLEKQGAGAGGEIQLTDAMAKLLAVASIIALSRAVELTPENWDAMTDGKTVFIKFLAPW